MSSHHLYRKLAQPALAGLVAVLSAACGSSHGPASPTGIVAADTALGATIRGTVNGGAAGPSGLSSVSSGMRVSVSGTALATTTDSSGQFVLAGVPAGAAALRFEGPGVDARLALPNLMDGQVLQLEVQVAGSRATLVSGANRPGGEVEFTGRVDALGRASLVVAGRTVLVSAATELRRGQARIGLADVRLGENAKVEGTLQADGGVLARQIKVGVDVSGDDDSSDDHGGQGNDDPPGDDHGGHGNDDPRGDDHGGHGNDDPPGDDHGNDDGNDDGGGGNGGGGND